MINCAYMGHAWFVASSPMHMILAVTVTWLGRKKNITYRMDTFEDLMYFKIQSTSLDGLWTFILSTNKIETGPGILYIVGKIFLQGVPFDIVYNESIYKNMKQIEKLVFPTQFRKNDQSFQKQRCRCVKQHSVIIHTYIYQIGSYEFRLLVRI